MALEAALAEGVRGEPNGRLIKQVGPSAAPVGHQQADRRWRRLRQEATELRSGKERQIDWKHKDATRPARASRGGRRRYRFVEAASRRIGDCRHAALLRTRKHRG